MSLVPYSLVDKHLIGLYCLLRDFAIARQFTPFHPSDIFREKKPLFDETTPDLVFQRETRQD